MQRKPRCVEASFIVYPCALISQCVASLRAAELCRVVPGTSRGWEKGGGGRKGEAGGELSLLVVS